MTIALGPLLAAVPLLLGARTARRVPDARLARSVATRRVAAALVLAAGCLPVATVADHVLAAAPPQWLTMTLRPPGWTGWMPVATCLAGLVAVGLAPVRSHPPRTVARMLLILTAGVATTATSRPAVTIGLWALAAAVLWLDLRAHLGARGTTRLFAIHQILGLALGVAGATTLMLGGVTATTVGGGLLAAAAAVRLGLLPVHLWANRLLETAPLGLAVTFLAAPTGPMLLLAPSAGPTGPGGSDGPGMGGAGVATGIVVIGAVTAVLSALLGLVQPEVRRGMAALATAASGVVAAGIASTSPTALTGAVLAWEVYAVAVSGTLMVIAATEARRGPLLLTGAGGSFARTPRLASAFLVFGLAVAGFPVTLGYASEDLLLDGLRASSPAVMVAVAVAATASGAAVVRWFIVGYTGRRGHDGESDLTRRELWTVTAVLSALLVAGLAPAIAVPHGPSPTQAVARGR